MNYVQQAMKPKRNEKAYLTVLEFLICGYNYLEIISELEEFRFYKHNLKRKIKVAEETVMKEIDSHIGQLIDIDSAQTWQIIENRRTILKEICMMQPHEAEVVNDVLKVLTPKNKERIQKYLKTLKKQS